MATFFPSEPGPDTPHSERAVWKALEQLPNSWRVFHSVAWQVPNERRVFDGEADFVLLHKRHGFIVLEVKGGNVSVEDGTWFQTGRDRRRHQLDRSPFDQAKSAMYDLSKYFEKTIPGGGGIPCTRAVVFPDVSHPGSMGPDAPAEQILARDELLGMTEPIEGLAAYGRLTADLSDDTINKITSLLAPIMRLQVLLRTTIAESNIAIIELTNQQIALLSFLRKHRRALITGVAGTGKTVLAMERARRLSQEGLRTLLVCYNRPLGEHIRESMTADGVVVGTFHQFALDLVRRAGFVAGIEPNQEWWDTELPDLLHRAAERLDEQFDAIVIDEGQDFKSQWFLALQLLLADPDDGPLYCFYDENQTIYVEGWEPPFDAEPFPLDTNCRNTKPIAEKVARVIGVDPASLGADGAKPVWVETETRDQQVEVLGKIVEGLLTREGLEPGQIVVLSDSRSFVDDLRGKLVGGVRLYGHGEKSGGTIETIHRFKGLESDVIVLVLDHVESERDRALAYIGMSRARALLVVMAPENARGSLRW